MYLNPVQFTRLFQSRRKNHADICLGMRLITNGIAGRFKFGSMDDKREAEADTLLFMIERIDRFKASKGRNAFSYYTSVAWNRLLFNLRAMRAPCGRQVAKGVYLRTFTDIAAAA